MFIKVLLNIYLKLSSRACDGVFRCSWHWQIWSYSAIFRYVPLEFPQFTRKGHTHRGRDSAMRRDFVVLKSRQICSLQSFIEKFITFQLLESYIIFISTKVFYCRPIYFVLKNEKSRRVAESRPVCVGLKSTN